MRIVQQTLNGAPATAQLDALNAIQPQLLLVFAASAWLDEPQHLQAVRAAMPGVQLAGCSTAGEIDSSGVHDGCAVLTAVQFDHADFAVASTDLQDMADSAAAGARLAAQLQRDGLHDVLVLGQGVNINGSALIEGFAGVLGHGVRLSGGLAGDGGAFVRTLTVGPDGVSDRALVAIGFYGEHLHLGHGSFGGWKPFGPARRVTRSDGNILYELDGEPALDIYKRYLGEHAAGLPASGLLFPFEMLGEDHSAVGLIRTILGVDEASGSLVLAGDIVQNGYLRLMHASTDALVDGAEAAAQAAARAGAAGGEHLALLVSCVGRKLVMGGRVDEEVEAVANVFGQHCVATGFYSYGEISPFVASPECKLHNQTMTITTLTEG